MNNFVIECYYNQGSWFPSWESVMLMGCTDERGHFIEDVKVPVEIFHGANDSIVSLENAYNIILNLNTQIKFNLRKVKEFLTGSQNRFRYSNLPLRFNRIEICFSNL